MSVHLVKGDDPVLRGDALEQIVAELVADDDRSLAVEDVTVPGRGEGDGADARGAAVATALNAASSPPFMTTRRVVVVRHPEHLTADDVEPLVRYLTDPLETTALVFVTAGGRIPVALTKAWRDDLVTTGPSVEKTKDVLTVALADAEVRLTAATTTRVVEHLASDAGRVPALVDLLASAFGPGSTLDVADVEPYLGEPGAMPVFSLTNAIERGDVAGALEAVHRALTVTSPAQPRPMHPLQLLGMLHGRYRRLLALDDPAIRSEADAHAALGGKGKPYGARIAWDQARSLGTDGLRRALDALHRADIDLKGASAVPQDAVLAILVARLAGLSRTTARRPARARA